MSRCSLLSLPAAAAAAAALDACSAVAYEVRAFSIKALFREERRPPPPPLLGASDEAAAAAGSGVDEEGEEEEEADSTAHAGAEEDDTVSKGSEGVAVRDCIEGPVEAVRELLVEVLSETATATESPLVRVGGGGFALVPLDTGAGGVSLRLPS